VPSPSRVTLAVDSAVAAVDADVDADTVVVAVAVVVVARLEKFPAASRKWASEGSEAFAISITICI